MPVLETAIKHIAAIDTQGKTLISNANSFSTLSDDYIVDKFLELAIDIVSLPIAKVHMLKDLENSRSNLAVKNQCILPEKFVLIPLNLRKAC